MSSLPKPPYFVPEAGAADPNYPVVIVLPADETPINFSRVYLANSLSY
jgi:hypothetical protein